MPDAAVADDRVASADIEQDVLRLFDDYRRPLQRYVASIGLNAQESEDVVQDVFLALFRHLQLDRSRSNLPGWLFRVARNLALRQRRRQRHWWSLRMDVAPEDRIDPAANPEERLADTEQRRHWQRVIGALPERDRRCLLLRAEGFKYRDIAAALGVSLGSVAKSMARALTRLEPA